MKIFSERKFLNSYLYVYTRITSCSSSDIRRNKLVDPLTGSVNLSTSLSRAARPDLHPSTYHPVQGGRYSSTGIRKLTRPETEVTYRHKKSKTQAISNLGEDLALASPPPLFLCDGHTCRPKGSSSARPLQFFREGGERKFIRI